METERNKNESASEARKAMIESFKQEAGGKTSQSVQIQTTKKHISSLDIASPMFGLIGVGIIGAAAVRLLFKIGARKRRGDDF